VGEDVCARPSSLNPLWDTQFMVLVMVLIMGASDKLRDQRRQSEERPKSVKIDLTAVAGLKSSGRRAPVRVFIRLPARRLSVCPVR